MPDSSPIVPSMLPESECHADTNRNVAGIPGSRCVGRQDRQLDHSSTTVSRWRCNEDEINSDEWSLKESESKVRGSPWQSLKRALALEILRIHNLMCNCQRSLAQRYGCLQTRDVGKIGYLKSEQDKIGTPEDETVFSAGAWKTLYRHTVQELTGAVFVDHRCNSRDYSDRAHSSHGKDE